MRKNHKSKPDVPFADRCFTIEETAQHLTISRGYVYTLLKTGRLTRTKLGTRTLIRGCEIEKLLIDGSV